MRIFILGANGVLGNHIMSNFLEARKNPIDISRRTVPTIKQKLTNPEAFVESLGIKKDDVVINALGVTRHRIERNWPGADLDSVELMNSRLPFALGTLSQEKGARVIQIGTDCVFSGEKGAYVESDPYDASDPYGLSKAVGESAPGICVIRSSSVGPSGSRGPQLWDWVKNQAPNSEIPGYSNVFWNGVTFRVHARLLNAIVTKQFPLLATQHLVPANSVSKDNLVRLIAKSEGRDDIVVKSSDVAQARDMTLSTDNESMNCELWSLIGFRQPPSIEELILKNSSSI